MKRRIALLLVICMLTTMLPPALAEEIVQIPNSADVALELPSETEGFLEDESTTLELGDIDLTEPDLEGLEQADDEAEILLDEEGESVTSEDNEESGNSTTQAFPKTLKLGVKQTFALNVSKITKSKKVTFKSSKTSVAAVSKKGVVTARKKGSAKISVIVNKKTVATCKVTVLAAPKKVTLPAVSIDLGVKETFQIAPKLPSKTMASFTYSSKNKKIASVSKTGLVKGVKAGKSTTITVTTHNKKKVNLTVNVKKAPSKVTLPKTLAIGKGETLQLTATLPNKSASALTWSTNKKKIATVTKDGVVKGVKVGTAKITVKTFNKKSAVCTVTVKKAPGKVTLDTAKATVTAGETLQLKATLPNKTASALTWTSSAKDVATVDENGLVTAVGSGKAKITVNTFNKKKAVCTVTVVGPTVSSVTIMFNGVVAGNEPILLPNESVTATWSAEGDVESYYYRVLDASGNVIAHEEAVQTTSYEIAEGAINPGEIYTLEVGAMPINGQESDIVWKTAQFDRDIIILPSEFNVSNGVLVGYTGLGGEVVIPETDDNGNSIVAIGDEVFKGNSAITSVFIPATVKEIGARVFLNTSGMKKIRIPDSVKSIGRDAFDSDITIFCNEGSYASEYAKANNLKYIIDGQYQIAAIRVEGNSVVTKIFAASACSLQVEILDETDEHVLDSVIVPINDAASYEEITVPFTSLPASFLIRATLINEAGKPLSDPYTENAYTGKHKSFSEKTPNDFDDDLVLEYADNGFSVFKDSTIFANGTESGSVFKISSEQKPVKGDTIYIENINQLVKVASVKQNGDGSYSITPDKDVTLNDFYTYMRYAETIDMTNVLNNNLSSGGLASNFEGAVAIGPIESAAWVNMSATIIVNLDDQLWGKEYTEAMLYFDIDYGLKNRVKAIPEYSKDVFSLPALSIPTSVPGMNININFAVPIKIGAEAELSFSVSGSGRLGFRHDPINGFSKIKESSPLKFDFYSEGGFEGSIGLRLSAGVGLLGSSINAEVGISHEVAFEAKAHEGMIMDGADTIDGSEKVHMCDMCFDMEITKEDKIDAGLIVRLLNKYKYDLAKAEFTLKKEGLLKGYLSVKNSEDSVHGGKVAMGDGECPNYQYRTRIDTYVGNEVEYANEVTISKWSNDYGSQIIIQGNSQLIEYLYPGVYEAVAYFPLEGDYSIPQVFTVKDQPVDVKLYCDGIPIDEEHFPDPYFRKYIQDVQDEDHNGILTGIERRDTGIIINGSDNENEKNIASLKGIQFFTELDALSFEGTSITKPDLKDCPKIKSLHCSDNGLLTSLDLSPCKGLQSLYCVRNKLTELDLSVCPELTMVDCWNNRIEKLNLGANSALIGLWCQNNQLKTLDLSACPALDTLNADNNQLTEIDVSRNTKLSTLYLSYNRLSALDAGSLKNLDDLRCDYNPLSTLNVCGCTALEDLYCYDCALSALDISGLNKLRVVGVRDNPDLAYINAEGCSNLTEFWFVGTDWDKHKMCTVNLRGCPEVIEGDVEYAAEFPYGVYCDYGYILIR